MVGYPFGIASSLAPECLADSKNQAWTHSIVHVACLCLCFYVSYQFSTVIYDLPRDHDLVGLVNSTHRNQLTAHLGKTLLAFNQIRVPGLEPGTYWTDPTQAVEVLLNRPAVLFATQRVRQDFHHVC